MQRFSLFFIAIGYTFLLLIACELPPPQAEETVIPAQTGYISLGEDSLYVRTMGQGPPLVILHGGPGMDHTYFLPQLTTLAEKHTLIFYDQRASGKSSFAGDSTRMRMNQFVADIESVREHFGLEQIHLLGHSWGGLLAMWYARTHPDRLHSLLLMNSLGADREFVQQAGQIQYSRFTPEDLAQMKAIRKSADFQVGKDSAVLAAFRMSFAASFYHRDSLNSLNLQLADHRMERQQKLNYLFRDMREYDLHAGLQEVKAPVLILHGDYDATPLAAMEKLQGAIPHAQLKILPMCGHFAFIEANEKVKKAVEEFISP